MENELVIRKSTEADIPSILDIYNQGIEDRIATLELDTKDISFMNEWYGNHNGRYCVIVAEVENQIVGWASLNRYSNRKAYDGVADLSIYIERSYRGRGVGKRLLASLEQEAKEQNFYKIVLFTFPFNRLGQNLYQKQGYREVGIFKNQGIVDGSFVDIMAMEKLL